MHWRFWFIVAAAILLVSIILTFLEVPSALAQTSWTHLSSAASDLPVPGTSTQQTMALILDIDRNGVNDFVIGARAAAPAMVWYRRNASGWTRYLIDNSVLDIEAGGEFHDLDGDGDLDIIAGGDYRSNQIWWWENPYPNFDPAVPWTRRLIKDSGATKHHHHIVGDFDGDGQAEFVFWNQGEPGIFLAEIPPDPRIEPWPFVKIYTGLGEGLAKADVDGDGQIDLLGGGHWFKHNGGTNYTAIAIDAAKRESMIAAGDLNIGGNPEVVMVPGDGVGRLTYYECVGNPADPACWVGTDLLGFDVDHGHSLQLVDMNGDGNLDIFVAEMRLDGGNPNAKMWLFYGDGTGSFTRTEIATGFGNHQSIIGDLDGDGDLDILGKPYNWDTPRVDIWLNNAGVPTCTTLPLNQWARHVVDPARPWRAVSITSADLDGDGLDDIITGGWWYRNPGSAGGIWVRNDIGAPLDNMAAVYDFDGDGDFDVLGTRGRVNSNEFVWAQNDGNGVFTIFTNIENGDGDFLQGVVVERFNAGGPLEVMLSWHASGRGIQRLTVPADPTVGTWTWDRVTMASQDEDLSVGDINRNGILGLLLGTQWLDYDGTTWTAYTLDNTSDPPDRNHLGDIDADGRLDAVVGFEAISVPGKLVWYQQEIPATAPWTEHLIATLVGPMSLDVADMDGDGDLDVVVGEHNLADPASAKLYVFENANGIGTLWTEHIVYTGDEHHAGAQVVDIDNDGDLDIISIGWGHNQVLLYENLAVVGTRLCVQRPPGGIPSKGTGTGLSDAAAAPAIAVADPFITKLADPPFALPGEQVTWTITITNVSNVEATNIRLTDTMPAEVEILSASATSGSVGVNGQSIDFTQAALSPGAVITITIRTRVRDEVVSPYIVRNVACVTTQTSSAPLCAEATVLGVNRLPETGEKKRAARN